MNGKIEILNVDIVEMIRMIVIVREIEMFIGENVILGGKGIIDFEIVSERGIGVMKWEIDMIGMNVVMVEVLVVLKNDFFVVDEGMKRSWFLLLSLCMDIVIGG